MRAAVVALVACVAMVGCAVNAPPEVAPVPAPVVCAPSAALTDGEPEPSRPAGQYTQRDVALYIKQLHRWGARGWEKLAASRSWSQSCVDRATVRAGSQAGRE